MALPPDGRRDAPRTPPQEFSTQELQALWRKEPTAVGADKLDLDAAHAANSGDEAAASADNTTAVIVRVSAEGYVPPGIAVRARISPTLFTADVTAAELQRLQGDETVASISRARGVYPAQP